jgi:ParB-like chromosome segregation protein Spo0J
MKSPKYEIDRTAVEDIYVPPGRRQVREETVLALMDSIKAIGLRTPITLRYVEGPMDMGDGHGPVHGVPVLVAGRHRLEAMRRLGEEYISHYWSWDDDEAKAELFEIDENLARAELTTDEKRQLLRRRKELWGQINEGGKSVPTHGGNQKIGFAADTAAATGLSKRRINQLLAEPKVKEPNHAEADTNEPNSKIDRATRRLTHQIRVLEDQFAAFKIALDAADQDARAEFLRRHPKLRGLAS